MTSVNMTTTGKIFLGAVVATVAVTAVVLAAVGLR